MSLKDCQAWKDIGFPLSTTSNEAAKMYDAIITQYTCGYDDDVVGHIPKCMEKMLTADPNFALGHAVKNVLTILGASSNCWNNPTLKIDIDKMVTLAQSSNTSHLERLHVDAVKSLYMGNFKSACDKWEEVLLYHPTDAMALRSHFVTCFYTGEPHKIRDTFAGVIQDWKTSDLYGNVKGMYAFGLEEVCMFPAAEKEAREGLELNPKDAWSLHTISHIKEMQGCPDEGIEVVGKREKDCEGNWLHGHLLWHLALYYIEKGDYETALTMYDDQLSKLLYGDHIDVLDITDATSLLYRLELEGVNVGDRWQKVHESVLPHIEDQAMPFNDLHYLMAAQGAKHKDVADRLMDSIRTFVSDVKDENNGIVKIYKDVALPMCQAFQAYNDGDYGSAVDLMIPIRYQIYHLGSSRAQADVFNLFLIHSALKSSEKRHQLLARSLLRERKAQRECTPMTDRLLGTIVATL
ncbi:tetratricopeptide repeat protein 38-like [Glandiceps talaboti]